MYLIYWTGKVWTAVKRLCEYQGIPFEIRDDSNPPDSYEPYEVIIPSPGVPSYHPIYNTGKVLCELDFASQFLPEKFQTLAVTGTDWKSTTSWILYSILEKEYFGKKNVYLSGNFDIPFSETILEILKKWEKWGIIVIEVSSFMSYGIGIHAQKEIYHNTPMPNKPIYQYTKKPTSIPASALTSIPPYQPFSPDYSVFINIKPDHLNWHKDLKDYFDAKMNLIHHTKKLSILNIQVLDFAKEHHFDTVLQDNIRYFTSTSLWIWNLKLETWNLKFKDTTDGEDIIISGRKKYKLSETHFSGLHNALNILAATLITNNLGICSKRTKIYLSEVRGLPHRLEFITEKKGVRFIEDSKSTSSQSLIAALSSFSHSTMILIAWWSDKWDHFEGLESSLSGIKFIVLMGATREILAKKCRLAWVDFAFAEGMVEAVELSFSHAKSGDSIVLSPGCASFGLFRDYLDRAHQFRDAVKKIPD